MNTLNKIFEIGEKIYPSDFSYFQLKNGETDFFYLKREEIKDKLKKGKPLIVNSLPYRREDDKGYLYEGCYFIDVKFEDSEEVYSILNTKTNVFKNYLKYLDWEEDCEMCAAFGY